MLDIAYEMYPEAAPALKIRRKVNYRKPIPQPKTISSDWEGCHQKYRENTYNFIHDKIVTSMSEQRLARSLPPADTLENVSEYGNLFNPDDGTLVAFCYCKLTRL